ncbi:phasin family protein [bacterium]|nr:phasin family protein [bacterium]
MKNFDQLFENINTDEWKEKAQVQGKKLKKEFDKQTRKIKRELKKKDINLDKVKENITETLERVNDHEMLEKAVKQAAKTRYSVLSYFNIPTQDEVVSLKRKIASLEKQLAAKKVTKTVKKRRAKR